MNQLDMKVMAQRKNLGKENLAKVKVGQLETNLKKAMKGMATPAGFPGVGKPPKKLKDGAH